MEPWIQTYTGKKFWPLAPKPIDIDILDIAHALSLKCRFEGHCVRFYSVAEHCCLVADLLLMQENNMQLACAGLLHDAAEAYLPDVLSPIKPILVGFAEIEEVLERAIAIRFNLPLPFPKEIKEADRGLLHAERKQVLIEGPAWSRFEGIIPDVEIRFLDPTYAEIEFLKRSAHFGLIRIKKDGLILPGRNETA